MTAAIDANAMVYMSDIAISLASKSKLRLAVAPLESVPEGKKDWHPGSEGKVLDLVHPALCPLIYGRSRILPHGTVPLLDCHKFAGSGEVVLKPEEEKYFSRNFQWLPCEVKVDDDDTAEITSYINNLHPSGNEGTYSGIADVITQCTPLWTQCLASTLVLPNHGRVDVRGIRDLLRSSSEDDAADNGDHMLPEPFDFGARNRNAEKFVREIDDLKTMFREEDLQVIVKMANILLTPESPQYDGDSWQIEGQPSEHVCASALYCYDEENVTPAYLAFRESFDSHALIEVSEAIGGDGYDDIRQIYGIRNKMWGIDPFQVLGQIRTQEGRLPAFPSVLQRKACPFELIDPTKPGHRKLLAIFLVAPDVKIPFTANVPPQQAQHWVQSGQLDDVLGRLPIEIVYRVIDHLDFPINENEAKRICEQLIEEWRKFQAEFEGYLQENAVSL